MSATLTKALAKLNAYRDLGIEAFILSGYPHKDECDLFGKYVLPPAQSRAIGNLMRFGLDLGGTKMEAVLLDDTGEIVWRERRPTPAEDYQAIIETIAALVAQAAIETAQEMTVGIGIPVLSENRSCAQFQYTNV